MMIYMYTILLLLAGYSTHAMQNVERDESLLTIKNDTGLQITGMEIFLKCFNAHPKSNAGLMKLILGPSHFIAQEKTFDVEAILFSGILEVAGWGGKSEDCWAAYLYRYDRLFTVYEAIKKYLIYGYNIKFKNGEEPIIKEYPTELADIEKMPAYKCIVMHLNKTANDDIGIDVRGEK